MTDSPRDFWPESLKCPRCGNYAYLFKRKDIYGPAWFIECHHCDHITPVASNESEMRKESEEK